MKKLYTFVETTDADILRDLHTFNECKFKGQYENVTVAAHAAQAITIKVDNDEDTFFFALKGETFDNIIAAIEDLRVKWVDELEVNGEET